MLTQKKNQFVIYSAIVVAMLCWGFSFVWTTIVFEYLQPITTILVRLILSTAFLLLLLVIFKKSFSIQRKDWSILFFSTFFNPFFYFIGENYGVKYSTPTISAVFIATIPIFSLIAATLIYRERLSRLNIVGFLFTVIGVVVMLLNREMSLSVSLIGVLSLSLAVISAVFYSIVLKKLADQYNPIVIVFWQNLIGAIMFIPLFLIFERASIANVHITFELVTTLVLLAVFASSIAFILFTFVTGKIGVSRTNVFTNFIPVVTAIVSWLMLGETMGINKIIGIIVVLIGVFLSQKKA